MKKRRLEIKTTVMSLFRRKPRGKSLRQTRVSTADPASGLFQGSHPAPVPPRHQAPRHRRRSAGYTSNRSEEHTSELQSLMRTSYDVCCLKTKILPSLGCNIA